MVDYPSLTLIFTWVFHGYGVRPLLLVIVIPIALIRAVFWIRKASPLSSGGAAGVLDWYHISIDVDLTIVLWVAGFANCWLDGWCRFWPSSGGIGDGGAIAATGQFRWVDVSSKSDRFRAVSWVGTTSWLSLGDVGNHSWRGLGAGWDGAEGGSRFI